MYYTILCIHNFFLIEYIYENYDKQLITENVEES
jgi:hypothetical protein